MSTGITLRPQDKLDVEEILQDLDAYRPPRKGWTWRTVPADGVDMGPFHYRDMAEPLERSIPLPAAKYFGDVDAQPSCVLSTEIASGHYEDDLRRMRMAAWHGADHLMVIRTTGQSHIDGLIEGTPEGVGGVPITRKQIRATRKACDLIEAEVGRPLNFHSYVSGVAGPEVAVLFAEEGVNGAHRTRSTTSCTVDMYRSYVDAGEAKSVMAAADIFPDRRRAQCQRHRSGRVAGDAGAARPAWDQLRLLRGRRDAQGADRAVHRAAERGSGAQALVRPPVCGGAARLLLRLQDARPAEHALHRGRHRGGGPLPHGRHADLPPHERRHPERDHARRGPQRALALQQRPGHPDRQADVGGAGWRQGAAGDQARRAAGGDGARHQGALDRVPEEILDVGGYFAALEQGFFVDSAKYPGRNGDGIARDGSSGVGADTIVERDPDYSAPVCAHFGDNHLPEGLAKPCDPVGGCTLCDPDKIVNEIHRTQMTKLAELCREKGIRDQVMLIAGGTQVTPAMAAETGVDATFGRGTKGVHVVDAMVRHLRTRGEV
jgi:D-ornithine 4,5-aminomutase subunit beta